MTRTNNKFSQGKDRTLLLMEQAKREISKTENDSSGEIGL